MWKHTCIIFMCTLYLSCVLSDDCVTPLGKKSKCVVLFDCPALLSVLTEKPIPTRHMEFLQKSQCGFQGKWPKVCCGPVPGQKLEITTTPAAGVREDRRGYSAEDSSLAPRDKCGMDTDGQRIYGGEDAKSNDFPWMALLGYKSSTSGIIKYECGGSLINRRYILTAAHCLIGDYLREYGPLTTIRLGEHDMSGNHEVDCPYRICGSRLQEIAVASTHPHTRYVPGHKNRRDDIGIVRLSERAIYTSYVQPICLVHNVQLPTAGDNAIVAGWGATIRASHSDIKRKVTVPIFDKDTCDKMFYSKGVSMGDGQLCAGGIFKEDSCRGDSGGPLMIKSPGNKWEAVGIVSFGWNCGRDGWPAVYTSVGKNLGWIKSTLQSTNHYFRFIL